METPLKIDFEHVEPSAAVRETIKRHVARMERSFGRITSGRVAIIGPSGHHKTGRYEVHIRLVLPDDREMDISRGHDLDERHTDLEFAIGDAFDHARRRLQDQVRVMRDEPRH